MKNLFDDDVYRETIQRIDSLSPSAEPEWGKMNAAQMFAHCAEPVEVSNGKELNGTPFMFKLLGPMLKGLASGDRPFPKNAGTHPQYVISDEREFEAEKARLKTAIDTWRADGPTDAKHPVFGSISAAQNGQMQYKHIDHHLRQFGV